MIGQVNMFDIAERWADVAGSHGKYQVSDKGNIRSVRRNVWKIDPKTGAKLEVYNSISEATVKNGLISKSNIGACCRGLKRTVGGFKWEYEGGGDDDRTNVNI